MRYIITEISFPAGAKVTVVFPQIRFSGKKNALSSEKTAVLHGKNAVSGRSDGPSRSEGRLFADTQHRRFSARDCELHLPAGVG